MVDDEIRRLISARATAAEIKSAAVAAGTRTLRDDGIRKILAGATTISEVERVTLEPEIEDSSLGVPPEHSGGAAPEKVCSGETRKPRID